MSTADRLHQLVLSVPGVATVYPVDPAWRAPGNRLGALLTAGTPAPEPEMVSLQVDASTASVRIRIGASGDVPAPDLARSVAAALRAALDTEGRLEVGTISVQICSIGALTAAVQAAELSPPAPPAPPARPQSSTQS